MSEHTRPSDTRPVFRLIYQARRILRLSWVGTGLALTVGLGVTALVVTALADLAVPLATMGRLVGLALVVLPALWVCFVGVIRPLFRRLRDVHMARRIESYLPDIHNRLVSCVDLSRPGALRRLSSAFYRRLVQEAITRIRGFRPSTVVDTHSVRRAAVFAISSLLTLVVLFFLLADRLPTAIARIVSPFADIPPATGVLYTVSPGDTHVLRGEEVTFVADVEKGRPTKMMLHCIVDQGEDFWHDLKADFRDNLGGNAHWPGSIVCLSRVWRAHLEQTVPNRNGRSSEAD